MTRNELRGSKYYSSSKTAAKSRGDFIYTKGMMQYVYKFLQYYKLLAKIR